MLNVFEDCLKDGINPDDIDLIKEKDIKEFIPLADEINKIYAEKAMQVDEFENSIPLEPKENPEDKLWAKHFEKKYKKIFGE
jgi:hypothetical protein